MRIIISPAKKMKSETDLLAYQQLPQFIKEAERLLKSLKRLNYTEAKKLWKCNDQIATLNYERIQKMDLYDQLTPAIFSYEGIQYQYMAPKVFSDRALEYIEKHLRILSGFYGLLRPFDGVTPYRLEMQAKLKVNDFDSLYDFWGEKLATQLFSESPYVINLASKEYSKCIIPYLPKGGKVIHCSFGEWKNGKVIEKGTKVKMARGEMVRFMAENFIESIEEIKAFDRLNYAFVEDLSDDKNYVFVEKLND